MGLSFDAYPPNEVTYMVGEAGHKKGNMHPLKVFFSGVSAGCLLSFAPASAATMTTSTWVSLPSFKESMADKHHNSCLRMLLVPSESLELWSFPTASRESSTNLPQPERLVIRGHSRQRAGIAGVVVVRGPHSDTG
jgi:hypothetical protein